MRTPAAFLACFFSVALAGFPGAVFADTQPDLTLPADNAAQWQVGFTVFTADSLSAENSYLAYSLPLLLRNELQGLDSHAFDDAEKTRLRQEILRSALLDADKKLTAARGQRDALAFTNATAAALKTADANVASLAERRQYLAGLDPALIVVSDSKPVAFKSGDANGQLLDAPNVPLDVYCASHDLDLVIGGSVKEVQGYIVVDAWAYDPLRRARSFATRDAGLRDELYTAMPGLGQELATSILGRDWTRVVFAPSPSRSSLFVDGALMATGPAPAIFLSPGTHEIRVSSPGYHENVRTLTLEAHQEAKIDDTLKAEVTSALSITSDPEGASLYLDSILLGVTPLTIPQPPVRSRAVLSLGGFYDRSFSLDPSSPPTLMFTLQKDLGDRVKLQKQARDDFYASFGWFALSIPLPLFSYGFAYDYGQQWSAFTAQGLSARASDAKTASYVFLGTYYAGIAVSVALFSWVVTRIINYVTVSNWTTN